VSGMSLAIRLVHSALAAFGLRTDRRNRSAGSTGAHVLGDGERAENESSLAATTLDSLFGDRVGRSTRSTDGRPVFADLMRILRERGFEFYDVAALASRRRDGRLRTGDVIFVRSGSALTGDNRWA
jgi:hypothetical protein